MKVTMTFGRIVDGEVKVLHQRSYETGSPATEEPAPSEIEHLAESRVGMEQNPL